MFKKKFLGLFWVYCGLFVYLDTAKKYIQYNENYAKSVLVIKKEIIQYDG